MSAKIGVQVYSVRVDAENDLYGTFKKIKEMGYEGVELAGLYGNEPKKVKEVCEEIGIVPISAHVPFGEFLKDLEGTVDKYAEIGCKFIAFPSLAKEYRPGNEKFDDFVEITKKVGKYAKEKGMTLLYHNHDFEFEKIDGKYLLDIMYETISEDYLQTELDTCWVRVGGEEPADYIKKYNGRTPVVHLKDYVGQKSNNMYKLIGVDDTTKQGEQSEKFELRPVGKGVQNFPKIIDAALNSGAEWLIVEQDSPSLELTPLECIDVCRKYLKSIGY